jgi:N utilization substance protein B
MLSRRSIRIKVMQLLYALNRDSDITIDKAIEHYWKDIEESYELFLYNIYTVLQISKVALEDQEKRQNKFLPTDEDKAFKPKLFDNPLMKDLDCNAAIQKVFVKYKFSERADKDLFRNIYFEYTKEPTYIDFIKLESPKEDEILEILLDLFRFCRKDSSYNELIGDQYVTWEDDKSLIVGSIKKVLKDLPSKTKDFYKEYYPDDETTKEFGEMLLNRTFEDDNLLLEIIKPVLKNWNPDRVAIIDMIFLKMAVIEFLHFQSIPPKVTMNEYVELAKTYSTSKSREFINGVLDKIAEELLAQGKIQKSGRGLEE